VCFSSRTHWNLSHIGASLSKPQWTNCASLCGRGTSKSCSCTSSSLPALHKPGQIAVVNFISHSVLKSTDIHAEKQCWEKWMITIRFWLDNFLFIATDLSFHAVSTS
jgi:hypothetical protein